MEHGRAAQYYLELAAKNCPPREKRRQSSDVEPFIEAVWQLCQAEQWQEAYTLMEREGIFPTLKRTGGHAILLELYQLLLVDAWQPTPSQKARIYNNLGVVYRILWRMEQALQHFEQALQIRRDIDRKGEGRTLKNLGAVYEILGQKEQALKYYKQSLAIAREVEDHEGEGKTLRNLGKLYLDQQRYEGALAAFLLARDMLREIQSTYYHESERGINTVRKTVGEEPFAALLANVEPRAASIVEQILNEETERKQ